ncbi:bleomycin resistance protein [Bradyrhizobium betae]|uniref:bleomycin resistance protein n=1 Tax=Bradyrhizobium betae TaxID=244734 RepID=UPI0019D6C5A8|nr:VOC family protein [Bradyrhizobium betae]
MVSSGEDNQTERPRCRSLWCQIRSLAPPLIVEAGRRETAGPAVVPELAVSDIQASLSFWCDLLGFEVSYDRPEARFAYLVRGPLQAMLCERNGRREPSEMQHPFGRGINLQMTVGDIDPILKALHAADWPLYEQPGSAWYRVGDQELGQREFLVQDPDGYLIRFAEDLGTRPPSRS